MAADINFENHFPKVQKRYIIDFINWCLEKYKIEHTIYLTIKAEDLDDYWGMCYKNDTDDFEIVVPASDNFLMRLITISHEMVHVRQFVQEKLRFRAESVTWKNKKYTLEGIDYWDRPWEIAAHGIENGQVVQWARQRRLLKRKWIREKIMFLPPLESVPRQPLE